MKLLAFADLHLGAGTSLGREPGDRLADQAAVLKHILARAVEHEAEAILVAGDIFEGPTVTPEQMDVFADFVDGCYGRGIPVVAISGNGVHDQAMRSVNGLAIFDRLAGIDVYDRPALHDLGAVQIACLPWVSPARLIAASSGTVARDSVNSMAAELIVRATAEIADPSVKPTVLLMHGSISGASLPQGIATDDLREPVVDVDALRGLCFAVVVAGHIHVPQMYAGAGWALSDPDRPFFAPTTAGTSRFRSPVVYTGSPMPLNFGEAHVPHGCFLLDVSTIGASVEFVPVESRPLRQTTFDIAGVPVDEFLDSIYDAAAWPEVDDAIVKVTVRCTPAQQRRLDIARLREAIVDAGAHTVKIDVETVREQRSRVDGVTDDLSSLDAFDAWVAVNAGDSLPGLVADAREQLQADLERVGA